MNFVTRHLNSVKSRVIFSFFLGFFFGILCCLIFFKIQSHKNIGNSNSLRQGGYELINPLLDCDYYDDNQNPDLFTLEKKVKKYLEVATNQKGINQVSVYYRDLNNGPWFGINEEVLFSPASLLKVPIMITYLKKAEEEPEILERILESDREQSNGVIQSYSISELINKMIIDSDNEAFNLLTAHVNFDYIKEVHRDLGLAIPDKNNSEDYISVKAYSSLFRILYNSSYLNREMSQRALQILGATSFKDGLVAGLPEEVFVSHKFGVKGQEGSQERQLHDCGIIYHDQNPYLLCVMTKGSDFSKMRSTIKEISKLIFDEVELKD